MASIADARAATLLGALYEFAKTHLLPLKPEVLGSGTVGQRYRGAGSRSICAATSGTYAYAPITAGQDGSL